MRCKRPRPLPARILVKQSLKTSVRWIDFVRLRIGYNKTQGSHAGKVNRPARLVVNSKSAIFDNGLRKLHQDNERSRKTWRISRGVAVKAVRMKTPGVRGNS